MLNPTVIKVAKIVVKGLSIVVPIVANHFDNKDLDDKIAKKVSEAMATMKNEES